MFDKWLRAVKEVGFPCVAFFAVIYGIHWNLGKAWDVVAPQATAYVQVVDVLRQAKEKDSEALREMRDILRTQTELLTELRREISARPRGEPINATDTQKKENQS